MLQSLPLDIKIAKTKLRIEEWYRYWGGQVYVSFSGGKDSTVLLHLVRSMYPNVEAVFSDTGLEYPEIRDFVKRIDNVTWIKPSINFRQIIKEKGYPVISKEQSQFIKECRNTKSEKLRSIRLNGVEGKKNSGKISEKHKCLINAPFKVSDECCKIMKKKPMYKYEKQSGKVPFVGVMADESRLRTTKYLRTGCNSFEQIKPQSMPIAFWKEQDIWEYIKLNNLEYSKIYDMGYERTGCMFCMYGIHLEKGENRFQRMQRTHPKQYDYCIRDEREGGLGMAKVLDFINVSYTNDTDSKKSADGTEYQQYKLLI